MLIRPPKILQRLYPSFIWSFPDEREGVFITFDDGPCPEVTPWVLDILDEFGAKATFFCIGKNVELYPKLYNEIIKRGHSVGNHSYSHVKGWKMEGTHYVRDVDTAAELIDSNLYRPPYAKITVRQAKMISEKFKPVMWSIISRDYNRKLSRVACARNVLRYVAPGEIIVFHDSKKCAKNLWYALPVVLQKIKSMGLVCKPIVINDNI
jgi:peptidoglycan-N-acetylglucosamine deacetylase